MANQAVGRFYFVAYSFFACIQFCGVVQLDMVPITHYPVNGKLRKVSDHRRKTMIFNALTATINEHSYLLRQDEFKLAFGDMTRIEFNNRYKLHNAIISSAYAMQDSL